MLKVQFLNDSHLAVVQNIKDNLKMTLQTTTDNRHLSYDFATLDKDKPLTKGDIILSYHRISASSSTVGMVNIFDPKLKPRNNHMLDTMQVFFHSKEFGNSQMNALIRKAIKTDIEQKKARELKKYNHIKHQLEFNQQKLIYHRKKVLHFKGRVDSCKPRLERAKKLLQKYQI